VTTTGKAGLMGDEVGICLVRMASRSALLPWYSTAEQGLTLVESRGQGGGCGECAQVRCVYVDECKAREDAASVYGYTLWGVDECCVLRPCHGEGGAPAVELGDPVVAAQVETESKT